MNSNNFKISVITIVYNGVNEIENTILSVINQKYPVIEYIIIDGNSSDGTQKIIQKYEKNIDFWISEPDKGVYDAMNKGVYRASGEWICFINSGDSFYSKQSLDNVFKQFILPEAVVIYGDVYILSFKSKFIKKAENLRTFKRGLPFSHQSSFILAKFIKDRPFNLDYQICADYELFYSLYLTEQSLFQYVPVVIASFDARNGLSSRNPLKAFKELARCRKDNHSFIWKFKFSFMFVVVHLKKIIKAILKLD